MTFNPRDVNAYFPFENIACNQTKHYRFDELDEQLILRGKEKEERKGCFFPCVDLNDLTAITPKQTLGDNSCSPERVYRLTLQFPEKTFAAHGVSLPCCHSRGVCGCIAVSKEQISFYVIKKMEQPVQPWSGYWFGPGFSRCGCLLALDFSFLCWADTCRVLTASWQTRFLNSWLDGGPPNKVHSCTHAPERCDGCVCTRLYAPIVGLHHWTHFWCFHADMRMFVCTEFILTDSSGMRVKFKQPGEKCIAIEEAGRQIPPWLQTAPVRKLVSQCVFFNTYLSVCEQVLKTPLNLNVLYSE